MAAIQFEMSDEVLTVTCESGDYSTEVHGHPAILTARSAAVMHAIETGHVVHEHETTDKVVRPCRSAT